MSEKAILAALAGMTQGINEGLEARRKRKQDEQELALKREELDMRYLDRIESRKSREAMSQRDADLRRDVYNLNAGKVSRDLGQDDDDTKIRAVKEIGNLLEQKSTLLEERDLYAPKAKSDPDKWGQKLATVTEQLAAVDENIARLRSISDKKPQGRGGAVVPRTAPPPTASPRSVLDQINGAKSEDDLASAARAFKGLGMDTASKDYATLNDAFQKSLARVKATRRSDEASARKLTGK